jgi:enoyl-CoA hydratase
VSLGLIPGYGGTQRLVQLIGKGKALELMLTADMIKADEALKLGLVNHVTSLEELIPATRDLMKKINTKSPVAIREVITCVNAYFESGTDGFEKEISQFGNCFGTDDFKEGTAAFIEKRKPEFSGN